MTDRVYTCSSCGRACGYIGCPDCDEDYNKILEEEMWMTTARNYFDGILGTILVIFGIMFLFVTPIFGLLMIIVGEPWG